MPYTNSQKPKYGQITTPDFCITYHGTIATITPLSDMCRGWIEANVAIEPWQRFGPSIAIEPRYVKQLVRGMIDAGFMIEQDEPVDEDY
jgi:hypothetical protein